MVRARPALKLTLTIAVTLLLAACSSSVAPDPGASTAPGATADTAPGAPPSALGAAPATVTTIGPPATPAPPGTLISAQSIQAPAHMHAWRIAYHSRSLDDHDIAVTGLAVAPETPTTTPTPVVTWGHPTTGSADPCAPSLQGTTSLPFPELLTARGIALVATDYPGLGTSDAHPYLVGASEGHSVLDAARALQQIPETGVTAASPVVVAGFSQGGHAAAFAGELAPTYAPDLDLRGVFIAAPVSDVAHFAHRAEGRDDQFGVLVTIVGGFVTTYAELDPASVFEPGTVAEIDQLETRCIGDINIFFDRPVATMLREPPTQRADFARRFAENQAGNSRIAVPVLVVQGALDDIVDPADTQAMVQRYCALGTAVELQIKPEAKHGVMSDQPFVGWIEARLAGEPAKPTC